ncbi:MAG: kinase [Thermoprotei archaeon]|nr:MAG: kinase [Thermoprotei archaeon]
MPIIFIGGTPGVGKTTVARRLAARLGIDCISVAELVVREGLHRGYDAERRAYVVDVEGVRERLRLIARGKLVVVETHVVDSVPPDQVEAAIILRLDPRLLEERLKARGYPPIKTLENVQAELLDACLIDAVRAFGHDRVFEVDTTGKEPDEVVDEIVKILEEGRGPKPGSVDWLSKLGEEAEKYLRQG